MQKDRQRSKSTKTAKLLKTKRLKKTVRKGQKGKLGKKVDDLNDLKSKREPSSSEISAEITEEEVKENNNFCGSSEDTISDGESDQVMPDVFADGTLDGPIPQFERKAVEDEIQEQRIEKEADEDLREEIEAYEREENSDLDKAIKGSTNVDAPVAAEEEGYDPTIDISMDQKNVKARLMRLAHTLAAFNKRRARNSNQDEGEERQTPANRTTYLSIMRRDLCSLYNYSPHEAALVMSIYGPASVLAFCESASTPRPLTIRCNILRTTRRQLCDKLAARSVALSPLGKWSTEGIQIHNSPVPIGATPEYLLGEYYIQTAASLLPVIALNPLPGEKIVDLCAAPGGKTTHIWERMCSTTNVKAATSQSGGKKVFDPSKSILIANDSSKSRAKALRANVARMGCTGVIVTCMDGTRFGEMFGCINTRNGMGTKKLGYGYGKGYFDRVLLDAPCSGLGSSPTEAGYSGSRGRSPASSPEELNSLITLQRKLLLTALDIVKAGGIVVYSTCSATPHENEAVVSWVVSKCVGAEGVTNTEDENESADGGKIPEKGDTRQRQKGKQNAQSQKYQKYQDYKQRKGDKSRKEEEEAKDSKKQKGKAPIFGDRPYKVKVLPLPSQLSFLSNSVAFSGQLGGSSGIGGNLAGGCTGLGDELSDNDEKDIVYQGPKTIKGQALLGKRASPHEHNMESFFVCVLRKDK